MHRRGISHRASQSHRPDNWHSDYCHSDNLLWIGRYERVGPTEAARKTTGSDDRVLPATVIYDSDLTLSLPVELSVASGLNGMAHCIDALWGPRADPINAALAAEGIRALAEGLSKIVDNPQGTDGRDQALYGAYLAAVSFAS